ncbi:hypothetical protein ACFYXS_32010 [Streptomyces sp. NPDC002574]|uniref:hypothetical protein n=1 Tax=Streptomyces sp. NPDC002574 TaxID=3364652 RepID=UPI0036A23FC9
MGRPEVVAAAALFLAGDRSTFTTGTDFFVHGGLNQVRSRPDAPGMKCHPGCRAERTRVGRPVRDPPRMITPPARRPCQSQRVPESAVLVASRPSPTRTGVARAHGPRRTGQAALPAARTAESRSVVCEDGAYGRPEQ